MTHTTLNLDAFTLPCSHAPMHSCIHAGTQPTAGHALSEGSAQTPAHSGIPNSHSSHRMQPHDTGHSLGSTDSSSQAQNAAHASGWSPSHAAIGPSVVHGALPPGPLSTATSAPQGNSTAGSMDGMGISTVSGGRAYAAGAGPEPGADIRNAYDEMKVGMVTGCLSRLDMHLTLRCIAE